MYKHTLLPFAAAVLLSSAVFFVLPKAAGQTQKVIHSFRNNGIDGIMPASGVILDAAGNLYGTTSAGGIYGGGTVFEFSPATGGGWTEKILHNFNNNGVDGYSPGAGLTLDPAGNLWGTTGSGGTYNGGVIFRLSPLPGGKWGERILTSFYEPPGGGPVTSSMLLDGEGNFYGTSLEGAPFGYYGMVFELKNMGGGDYSLLTLHAFPFGTTDGCFPRAGVTFDGFGNLYGTTANCGADQEGVVYKLSPQSDGVWNESILYNFADYTPDNGQPFGTVAFDASGNLFGTSFQGGTNTCGEVFELAPVSGAIWNETLAFSFDCQVASYPMGPLLIDSSGNIYGTATGGGGGVYKLTPGVGGTWTQTILGSFSGANGQYPSTGIIRDGSGNIYGTTTYGGADTSCEPFGGCGTLFEIRP